MYRQEIREDIIASVRTNGKGWVTGADLQRVLLELAEKYFHVNDKIPISSIRLLQGILDNIQKQTLSIWLPTEVYPEGVFRSYTNPASLDARYRSELIYRCRSDTALGESPESHPEKWKADGSAFEQLSFLEDGFLIVKNNQVQTTDTIDGGTF